MEAGLAYRKRRTIKGLHAQEPCRDPLALIPSIPRCSSIHLDSVLFLPLSSQAHSVLQRQLLPPCVLCVQLRPTLHDPMDGSQPGSSVHVILQARRLEWIAMPSSRGSSQPRDQIYVSCIGRWILCHWATWEAWMSHWCHLNALKVRLCLISDLGVLGSLKKGQIFLTFTYSKIISHVTVKYT